ncbi:MAG: RsmE family RNA methyltransferase [Candidatus Acidiferrales bacterium]
MRRRFYVEQFAKGSAVVRGETAGHLARVLRAEAGQLYELSDGETAWVARVERVTKKEVEFALVEPLPARAAGPRIALLLSIVKFDRFEWCLEKTTELGVSEIVPLAATRSEKGLLLAAAKRATRWEKILREAAQQARLLKPPVLREMRESRSAFSEIQAQLKLFLSERSGAPALRSALAVCSERDAALAIGPEGGWTDEEIAAAIAAGFREVSLGENILRTETAVIAALAIVQYELGAKSGSEAPDKPHGATARGATKS